jgi:3-hydroxymyristoyl/3-hydroxydecanoyl-(acyl carrier protein) dehydratase
VAGKRSSLGHLNFQLNRIDGVTDGAFWMPDETPGEVVRPVAFVVAPGLEPRAIVAALRQRLEAAFVPRRVIAVDRLPREATGKLTVATLDRFARETLLAVEGRRFVVAPDHPALAGHFPGHPLLPGVVLLGWVLESLDAAPALKATLGASPQIEQVKFVAPVGPGQAVDVRIAAAGRGLVFEVRRGDVLVAKGTLSP